MEATESDFEDDFDIPVEEANGSEGDDDFQNEDMSDEENTEEDAVSEPATLPSIDDAVVASYLAGGTSNVFSLEVAELLKSVSVNYSRTQRLEAFLHSLRKCLSEVPQTKVSISPGQSVLGVPFRQTKPLTLEVSAPSRIDIVGSYLLQSTMRADANVDVCLEIPKKCFYEKDFLDYRYFDRRNLFLSGVAQHLVKQEQFRDISVSYFCDDTNKPILELRPSFNDDDAQVAAENDLSEQPRKKRRKLSSRAVKKDQSRAFVIRLIPCISAEQFKAERLAPTRNCVRKDGVDAKEQKPTAAYNSAILEDTAYRANFEYLHSVFSKSEHVPKGVLLIKTWMKQRSLLNSRPSSASTSAPENFTSPHSSHLSGFFISMLVAHLVAIGRIQLESATPFQIFATVLRFLVEPANDMVENGVAVQTDDGTGVESVSDFLGKSNVVFVGPTGINLTSRVSKSAYLELLHHARLSLTYLDGVQALVAERHGDGSASVQRHSTFSSSESMERTFELLFLTPVKFQEKYDAYLSIKLEEEDEESSPMPAKYRSRVSNLSRRIFDKLSLAFTDRVEALSIRAHSSNGSHHTSSPSLRIHAASDRKELSVKALAKALNLKPRLLKKPILHDSVTSIAVGLVLNRETCGRLLDRGPPGDDRELARAFRQFWGKRSELRRFKDGKILEAVHWGQSIAGPHANHHVVYHIAQHILERHLKLSPEAVSFFGSQLDSTLLIGHESPVHAPSDTRLTKLHAAFEKLQTCLRGMRDVPLTMRDIQCTHSALRYCSVFPPKPIDWAHVRTMEPLTNAEPVPVVVQFESSGKWPLDINAIARIKTAFFIRMNQSLRDNFRVQSTVSADFLDVFLGDFAFRLRIRYEPELPLLEESDPARAISVARSLIHAPVHAGSVLGFYSRFRVFSDAVRLAKRWVASHLFSSHLCEEAVELLMVASFTSYNALPHTVPASALVGFRRFLTLLAKFDWKNSPLVVDFSSEVSVEQRAKIQKHFSEARAEISPLLRAGGPAMYVATLRDPFSQIWTGDHPSQSMLERIVSYARSSLALINTNMENLNSSEAVWKSMFKTPTADLDFVVKLNPLLVANKDQQVLLSRAKLHKLRKRHAKQLESLSTESDPSSSFKGINFDATKLAKAEAHKREQEEQRKLMQAKKRIMEAGKLGVIKRKRKTVGGVGDDAQDDQASRKELPMVGFDPISTYIEDLSAELRANTEVGTSPLCWLLHDPNGGDFVGVKLLDKETAGAHVDRADVAARLEILGEDLVVKVSDQGK